MSSDEMNCAMIEGILKGQILLESPKIKSRILVHIQGCSNCLELVSKKYARSMVVLSSSMEDAQDHLSTFMLACSLTEQCFDETIREHVENCPECSERLETLRSQFEEQKERFKGDPEGCLTNEKGGKK